MSIEIISNAINGIGAVFLLFVPSVLALTGSKRKRLIFLVNLIWVIVGASLANSVGAAATIVVKIAITIPLVLSWAGLIVWVAISIPDARPKEDSVVRGTDNN